MNRHMISFAIVVCVLGTLDASRAVALNTLTHKIINEQATRRSSLNQVLKNQLGFPGGIEEFVDGRQVFEWLGEGGIREDDGLRFLLHFHDPLQPWDSAGLGFFDSSVRWMQRAEQDWSWPQAGEYYRQALTAASRDKRDEWFAKMFRTLGQLMHLVVDASVPEHVRNDPHPLGPIYGNYEYWVSDQHGRPGSSTESTFVNTYLSTPIGFDPAILQQPPGDAQAPVPIARLIDTNTYKGLSSGPNVTLGPAIGIAEVANANFFSEDTGDREYPFPNLGGLVASQHPAPKTGRVRAYFAKGPNDGLPADPVLAECVLYEAASAEGVAEPVTRMCVDENVWAQTGRAMLPRAVGYARGVVDYFFRGRLEASFVEGPNGGRERILRTRNASGEAIGPGTLQLLYEDSQGTRLLIQEQPVPDLGGTSDLPVIQFDIPVEPPSQYVVVYRGRLGLEADAVVGRVLGGLPIVAVQQLAALTGEEFDPGGGHAFSQSRRKNPNHQRAQGYFWAGGTVGVGKKIREVRLEEASVFEGLPPAKAVLRINGIEVGTHWRVADDPGLLPERWEVVLAPIPGQTSEEVAVPPPAIWVNDFRTPLLWIQEVLSTSDSITYSPTSDGVPIWTTTRSQFAVFYFGDGRDGVGLLRARYPGLDTNFRIPLTTPRTQVSFRPVGEVAGLAVPQGEVEVALETCTFSRFLFLFGRRQVFPPPFGPRATCGVGSEVFWAKSFVDMIEATRTVGPQPVLVVAPLLTAATFRREFLEADLERFLSVGVVPPEYEIQTQ